MSGDVSDTFNNTYYIIDNRHIALESNGQQF